MTPEQFAQKMGHLLDTIEDITLDAMDTAAMDSIALLQRRLQEEGKDAQGNDWRPYSEEYKEWKEKQGKAGNGKVNFTLYARMLNNIGIVSKTKGRIVTVRVRPKSEENQLKMEGLSYGIPARTVPASKRTRNGKTYDVKSYQHKGTKGRGRIMDLSQKEEDLVKKVFMDTIVSRVKETLA